MELKDFISDSLSQIWGGLREANENLKKELEVDHNFFLMRPGPAGPNIGITFDIAITTKNEASGGAEAKAKILVFEASAGGKGGVTNETASRISFQVELKNWIG